MDADKMRDHHRAAFFSSGQTDARKIILFFCWISQRDLAECCQCVQFTQIVLFNEGKDDNNNTKGNNAVSEMSRLRHPNGISDARKTWLSLVNILNRTRRDGVPTGTCISCTSVS